MVSEYNKLKNQPLKFVLAEFRFSQIMEIEKYIPKIQEELRKTYPLPDLKKEQDIKIEANGLSVSTINSWLFQTGDKKSVVSINQDRLVFYTSTYARFEQFSQSCEEVLEILEKIVEPTLILRIGLRYSDLVLVKEKENIRDLVDSNFTFTENISELGKGIHQRCETILATEHGILAIRTLYGYHNLTCLQDIREIPVQIKSEKEPSERIILDFDHFWEPKETITKFETQNILTTLSALHRDSRKAFWKITTDYARNEKWS